MSAADPTRGVLGSCIANPHKRLATSSQVAVDRLDIEQTKKLGVSHTA